MLEGRLSKLRQEKMQAVESDDKERVVALSKEDADLSAKLDEAYQLWQTCKRNYESESQHVENRIIAESLVAEYDLKDNERASVGNRLFNQVSRLNEFILEISNTS